MAKDTTVTPVYNDPAGYGSLNQTLSDARETDPSAKMDDVRQWVEKHTKRKQQLPRPSSFEANGPIMNTNLTLCVIKHLGDQDYEIATLCIDALTTY